MKSRCLLDTDWIIDYLKGQTRVVERLNKLWVDGLGISIISLAELYEGVYYSSDPERSGKALDDFLSGVEVIGLDMETCRLFGRLRGQLRQKGQLVGDFDTLIAATCFRHDLTLFTNNGSRAEHPGPTYD